MNTVKMRISELLPDLKQMQTVLVKIKHKKWTYYYNTCEH
jgi:hypothetical protein